MLVKACKDVWGLHRTGLCCMSCFCPVLNSLLRPRRIVTMCLREKIYMNIYVCITCRISIYVVYMSVLMCVPFTHTNLILINLSGASRVLFLIKSIALFTAFTAGRGLAVGIKFFLRNPARCERSCEQFFFSPGIDACQAFLGPCYLVAIHGGASGPEGIAKFGLATGAEASKASPNACRLTSGPDLEVQSCKDLQN